LSYVHSLCSDGVVAISRSHGVVIIRPSVGRYSAALEYSVRGRRSLLTGRVALHELADWVGGWLAHGRCNYERQ